MRNLLNCQSTIEEAKKRGELRNISAAALRLLCLQRTAPLESRFSSSSSSQLLFFPPFIQTQEAEKKNVSSPPFSSSSKMDNNPLQILLGSAAAALAAAEVSCNVIIINTATTKLNSHLSMTFLIRKTLLICWTRVECLDNWGLGMSSHSSAHLDSPLLLSSSFLQFIQILSTHKMDKASGGSLHKREKKKMAHFVLL